jgi:hypothetical protein
MRTEASIAVPEFCALSQATAVDDATLKIGMVAASLIVRGLAPAGDRRSRRARPEGPSISSKNTNIIQRKAG